MRSTKTRAAIAALITAGAIAAGAATGGAFSSTQARRSNGTVPPWCGVICMRDGSSGSQEQALSGRKAGGRDPVEYLAVAKVRPGMG